MNDMGTIEAAEWIANQLDGNNCTAEGNDLSEVTIQLGDRTFRMVVRDITYED